MSAFILRGCLPPISRVCVWSWEILGYFSKHFSPCICPSPAWEDACCRDTWTSLLWCSGLFPPSLHPPVGLPGHCSLHLPAMTQPAHTPLLQPAPPESSWTSASSSSPSLTFPPHCCPMSGLLVLSLLLFCSPSASCGSGGWLLPFLVLEASESCHHPCELMLSPFQGQQPWLVMPAQRGTPTVKAWSLLHCPCPGTTALAPAPSAPGHLKYPCRRRVEKGP